MNNNNNYYYYYYYYYYCNYYYYYYYYYCYCTFLFPFIYSFFERRRKKRTPDTFFFTSTNVFVLGEVRKRKMRTDKGSVTGIFFSKTKIRKCSILNCVYVFYVPLHIKWCSWGWSLASGEPCLLGHNNNKSIME